VSDTTKKNEQVTDAAISGPTAEQLRRPLQKSLGQIAREQQQEHEEIVRKMREEVHK